MALDNDTRFYHSVMNYAENVKDPDIFGTRILYIYDRKNIVGYRIGLYIVCRDSCNIMLC